jgi:ferredoxin-NADP reductase
LERLTPVPQRAPGRWQVGTVTSIHRETPRVKTFRIELPMWMPHLPGQHYDVRLTAPDGYRAQRSYSIASSPLDRGVVELTIDRLEDGEVSPYFHDVLVEGDDVELRGPFASFFVWRGESPVVLLAGGSGVVPADGDAAPPSPSGARAADAPAVLGAPRGRRDLRERRR